MYLYRDAKSFFHSLHPLTKFFLLLATITMPFFANTIPLIVVVFVLYTMLVFRASGGPNLKKFWKMLLIFWVFTFGIWILIPKLRGAAWSFENAALLATRGDTFVLWGLLLVTC